MRTGQPHKLEQFTLGKIVYGCRVVDFINLQETRQKKEFEIRPIKKRTACIPTKV